MSVLTLHSEEKNSANIERSKTIFWKKVNTFFLYVSFNNLHVVLLGFQSFGYVRVKMKLPFGTMYVHCRLLGKKYGWVDGWTERQMDGWTSSRCVQCSMQVPETQCSVEAMLILCFPPFVSFISSMAMSE